MPGNVQPADVQLLYVLFRANVREFKAGPGEEWCLALQCLREWG